MTALLARCAGALYMFPVATYSARREASTVGADQTAAPAGPHSATPALLVPRRCGSSVIVCVFQITRPSAASRATTLPRNVQQAYCGSAPCASSYDDTPT